MKKRLQQEYMIWLQSSTGEPQHTLISQYESQHPILEPFVLQNITLKHTYRIRVFSLQISDYKKDIEIMQNITKEEYLASLRR